MKAKNQQFKRLLRKSQIQQSFHDMRKQLTFTADSCYSRFTDITSTIKSNMVEGNFAQTRTSFRELIDLIRTEKKASTFFFMHSQKVSQIIVLIFSKQAAHSEQQIFVPRAPQKEIVDNLFQVLSQINYNILDQSSFGKVFLSLWQILQHKELSQSLQIWGRVIFIINRMMKPPNQIVYNLLRNCKISQKISQLLRMQKKRSLSIQIKCQILEMISLLIQNSQSLQQQPCIDSKQSQEFLVFALESLTQLHSKYLTEQSQTNDMDQVFNSNLKAIRYLLSFQAELAKRISKEDLPIICQMMDWNGNENGNERQIQLNAAQIINIIVLQNSKVCDLLVGGLQIVGLIDKLLRKQLYCSDEETNKLVQKYSFVLCNLIHVRDNKLKMKLFEQPVWELAQNILNRFKPLIVIFQFYFQVVPMEQLLNKAVSYLDTVTQIVEEGYLDPRYKKSIEMTIHRLFYMIQEQLPDSAMQIFIQKIQQNKYLHQFMNEDMTDKIMDLL